MSFSIRLHSLKCLEESGEPSDADEPFVLVTSVDLRWPGLGIAPPITFRYGEWKNFDKDESLTLIGETPFWGMNFEPDNIANVNDVCFVVTMMEHDHGDLDAYRGTVEAAAKAELPLSVGLKRSVRVTRLLNAIRSAIGLLDLPSLDDHVGTKELPLDGSDLIPLGSTKDKVMEIDGGDEGKWELTFRIVHHRRLAFPPDTHLAAVSRAEDLMEIWAVGGDELLHGNWFQGRWHGWYTLPGEKFNVGTHLAAVSRHANHMEVWAVGQDGIVRGVWYDGEKWRDWYSLPGAKFPPGSPLAAVSRDPEHIEIWGVDEHGIVRGTWADSTHWSEDGWYALGGVQFPLGVHLTALSRSPDHMEIWVVTDDKPIMGRQFDENAWKDWYPLGSEIFSPHTHIAAIKRHYNMHVFAQDLNGHIQDYWFDGTTWRGWSKVGNEFFDQGTPLAAVSRRSDRMEVWACGQDAMIRDDWFEITQWKGWFIQDSTVFDQGTHLAAVSRHEDHMEVWGLAQGVVRGNGFFDSGWHGWYQLPWSFEG